MDGGAIFGGFAFLAIMVWIGLSKPGEPEVFLAAGWAFMIGSGILYFGYLWISSLLR